MRAFTHGYDLYHPHKVIVSHEYTRSYGRKHWEDRADSPDRHYRQTLPLSLASMIKRSQVETEREKPGNPEALKNPIRPELLE